MGEHTPANHQLGGGRRSPAVLRQQERMITSSDRARQTADPRTADLHMAARNWALADRSLLLANTTVFRQELASDA